MRVKELKQKWKQFISTLLIVLLTLQPCAGMMPTMVAFGETTVKSIAFTSHVNGAELEQNKECTFTGSIELETSSDASNSNASDSNGASGQSDEVSSIEVTVDKTNTDALQPDSISKVTVEGNTFSFTGTTVTAGSDLPDRKVVVTAGGKSATLIVTIKASSAVNEPTVELSFNPTELSIEEGAEGTSTLTATEDGKASEGVIEGVKYTSDNASVATVSGDGTNTATVKAVAEGTATITATYTISEGKNVTATLTVTVTKKASPDEPEEVVVVLSFEPTELSIEKGAEGTSTLTATVNGEASEDVIKSVKYTSNNEAVATVSGDGTATATVKAVAAGTATITATYTISEGKNVTATLTVTVTEKVVALSFEPVSLSIEKDAEATSTLTATVNGEASQDVIKDVKYTSSDESVATVSGDGTATATVKAVAKGMATITATYPTEDGSVVATLKVSVYEPEDEAKVDSGTADVEIAMDEPELPEMPSDEVLADLTEEQIAQIEEEVAKAPQMAEEAKESIVNNTYVQTAKTEGFNKIDKSELAEAGVPIGEEVEIYPKQTLSNLEVALEKQADGTYKSVVKKVIYDITPNWKLKGEKNENGTPFTKKVKGTFTFSIPVPSNVTARYANVTHESKMKQYTILTKDTDKYITITVDSFSPFELEFTDTRETSTTVSGSSGGGGGGGGGSRTTGSSNSYTMTGSWIADATGWKFLKSNGQQAVNTWGWINNQWYYFDATGTMATGWRFINNKWYYMNPVQGSTEGVMVTGWNLDSTYNAWFFLDSSGAMVTGWYQIGDKWYYFNPISDGTQGAMAMNTYVDGYYVGADGAWIPTN